jgi:hypothetical protein
MLAVSFPPANRRTKTGWPQLPDWQQKECERIRGVSVS